MGIYEDRRTESEMTRRITKTLTNAGALVIPIVGGQMQRPGLPDRMIIHRIWSGFIEAKREMNALTEAQRIVRDQCLARHFPHIVARYFEVNDLLQIEIAGKTWHADMLLHKAMSGNACWGLDLMKEFKQVWNEYLESAVHDTGIDRGQGE